MVTQVVTAHSHRSTPEHLLPARALRARSHKNLRNHLFLDFFIPPCRAVECQVAMEAESRGELKSDGPDPCCSNDSRLFLGEASTIGVRVARKPEEILPS